ARRAHQVLDEENGDAARTDLPNQADRARDLAGIQPGEDLVEEQDARAALPLNRLTPGGPAETVGACSTPPVISCFPRRSPARIPAPSGSPRSCVAANSRMRSATRAFASSTWTP